MMPPLPSPPSPAAMPTLTYTLTETTTQFTIAPKTLTVSKGDLAYTKEYDGTTTASATGALSVDKVDADDVTVTIGSAVYADETAGTGKTVNLSGLTLAGTKAGNYVLAADTYTFTDGVITAKEVTVSGITAEIRSMTAPLPPLWSTPA